MKTHKHSIPSAREQPVIHNGNQALTLSVPCPPPLDWSALTDHVLFRGFLSKSPCVISLFAVPRSRATPNLAPAAAGETSSRGQEFAWLGLAGGYRVQGKSRSRLVMMRLHYFLLAQVVRALAQRGRPRSVRCVVDGGRWGGATRNCSRKHEVTTTEE